MTENFVVRRMKAPEVEIAIEWAKKEGWNPGLDDARCFLAADPQGFFIGLLNGEPIATGAAIAYDEHFAFCGLYIVKPEYRGKGYGIQLTHERLKYLGNRITGLDGVLNKVEKYERLGYVAAHKNIRYVFSPVSAPSSKTVDLKTIPLASVESFDRKYFPAPRADFLKSWIEQSSHAVGFLEDRKLKGYGVIRKCFEGYKIGPLFADSESVAEEIFKELCSKAKPGPITIDIPETNQAAQGFIQQYKMNPQFEVIRMYRNGFPILDINGVYGITTYELG